MILKTIISLFSILFILSYSFGQVPSYVPTDNLVGWWGFNGNANDESGNGNNGTVNGATLTTDRFGNPNSAYDFNNDYIDVGKDNSLTHLTSFTISLWVKIDNKKGHGHGLFGSNHNDRSYLFNISSVDNFQFPVTNSSSTSWDGFAQSSSEVSDGIWHHLVGVFEPNQIKIYIDLNDETNLGNVIPNSVRVTNQNIIIGTWKNAPNYYLEGKLDDIGIWNRALTQCEISQLYHAQQLSPPALTLSDTISACGASTTLDAGTNPAYASYLWNTTEITPTISVTNSGEYSVQVTDTNGCVGYDTTYVSLIDPTINQVDTTICLGDSLVLSIPSPTGSSCTNLPSNLQNGLVGYWPFCGNANDESGNGNDGTVNGATLTTDRFGNANSAYDFDGNSSYIVVSHNSTISFDLNDQFTVACWFDITDNTTFNGVLLSKWDGTAIVGNPYPYVISSGSDASNGGDYFICNVYDGQVISGNTNALNILSNNLNNSWNHGILKYNNGLLYMYLNGNLIGIDSLPILSGSINNTFDLQIGRRSGVTINRYFNGQIDDIGIWNRALSDCEIQQLYYGCNSVLWSTGETCPSITVYPTTTTTYSVTVSDGISSCTDDVTVTVNNPQIDAGNDTDVCSGNTITLSGSGASTYNWTGGITDGVSFTPSNSGYYYVTGTYSDGCEGTDSVYVTLKQSTTGTDIQTACDSYTWIDGITYTSSTNTPTYVLTNTQGCDSIVTLDLVINSIDKNITNDFNYLESLESNAQYQWVDCNNNNQILTGEINFNFKPSSNGEYAVIIEKNGCIDTSQCVLIDYLSKFSCSDCEYNSLFQVHSNSSNSGSRISELNLLNSNYNDLSNSPLNIHVNAIGMNVNDSLAYGIKWCSNELIRIDANGTMTNLGVVTGLPNACYDSGDFGPDGLLHIRKDQGQTMYKIDVSSVSVIGTYVFDQIIEPGDFALNLLDNLFYTVLNNGDLVTINPSDGKITIVTQINLTGNFGALFSDASGRVWALQNSSGNLYEINLSSGTYTLISQMNPASINDGFSCRKILNSHPANFNETIVECSSYTWPADGQTYSQSGQYTALLTNQYGCDSIVTLDLTINQPTTGVDVQTVCDSYTWIDGITYTSSTNTPTFVLTNAEGCDSTVTLDLTITNSSTGIETVVECASYTWPTDGQTYSQSGQYTALLTNQYGCDSTVTLDLTINQPTTGVDVQTACDSYTWIDGITYTSSTSTPIYVLTNAQGCDSTVTLDLTITNSNTGIETVVECSSYIWAANGQTYSQSGQYTAVLTNQYGCDSTVTLDLTINQPTTGVDVQTACDSYIWIDGITYTSSTNTPTYVLTNQYGCDSTVTLNLTINKFSNLSYSIPSLICEGASIRLLASGGVIYQWDNGVDNGEYIQPLLGLNTYQLQATDDKGCMASATITVEVVTNPELSFITQPVKCKGYNDGVIEAVVTNGQLPYSYDWDNGESDYIISELRAGAYILTVTDANFCSVSEKVELEEIDINCLNVNNGLSPNGDGINDVWEINGLDIYPDAEIKVLNRWGSLVYNYQSEKKFWDGTYEGKDLPSADYYYIIKVPGTNIKMNGVISLKR